MKKSLNISSLCLILFVLVSNLHGYSQSKTVAHLDNINNIEISKSDIKNYLKKFEPMETFEITEMKISNQNNEYFLLVKCKLNKKENWIYIVQLKSKTKKLVIKKGMQLNACETDITSIDSFNINNGEIKGCVKYNHKVMGNNDTVFRKSVVL